MKKIGFVDLYLSEWHADNYPAWMQKVCEQENLDYQVCYGWAEQDVSPVSGITTQQWCAAQQVEHCKTLAELCEKSDCIVILAPSNPETHLAYAQAVLPYQKPTYIDKTFAPDTETAKGIIALSQQYGTPFFTTSALRYATELLPLTGADTVRVQGAGSNLPEYIIHQAEMVVKVLGVGAEKIRAHKEGEGVVFEIAYPDNRQAQMHYDKTLGFACTAEKDGKALNDGAIQSDFFMVLMSKILNFFESREIDFPMAETVEVMRIREGAILAAECPDTWITLP